MWDAEAYSEIDQRVFATLHAMRDSRGSECLHRDRAYLAVSPHQPWIDIAALIDAFNQHLQTGSWLPSPHLGTPVLCGIWPSIVQRNRLLSTL